MKGYFTVEATALFSIIFFVYAFIIYIGFYQYNRCLMEQDGMRMALWGSVALKQGSEEAVNQMLTFFDTEGRGKYIAWEMETPRLSVGKGKIRVEQEGHLTFPFFQTLPDFKMRIWEIHDEITARELNHVFFIRLCRRLQSEMKD